VNRPWLEVREAQPFEQVVHAVEAVLDAELFFEDPHGVLAAQRAHAVGLLGPGKHALAEGLFLITWQLGGPTLTGLGGDRIEPAVAVGVAPLLHKVAATPEHGSDHRFFEPVEREPHRPQTVALHRVLLGTQAAIEFSRVVIVMQWDMHSRSIATTRQRRNTKQAPNAPVG